MAAMKALRGLIHDLGLEGHFNQQGKSARKSQPPPVHTVTETLSDASSTPPHGHAQPVAVHTNTQVSSRRSSQSSSSVPTSTQATPRLAGDTHVEKPPVSRSFFNARLIKRTSSSDQLTERQAHTRVEGRRRSISAVPSATIQCTPTDVIRRTSATSGPQPLPRASSAPVHGEGLRRSSMHEVGDSIKSLRHLFGAVSWKATPVTKADPIPEVIAASTNAPIPSIQESVRFSQTPPEARPFEPGPLSSFLARFNIQCGAMVYARNSVVSHVPSPLSAYTFEILEQLQLSNATVALGLLYMHRLCDLQTDTPRVGDTAVCGHCLVTVCLLLAEKYLQDHDACNEEWATKACISLVEINRLERKALQALDYRLHAAKEEFDYFLRLYRIDPHRALWLRIAGCQ